MNSFPYWSQSLKPAVEMFYNLQHQDLHITEDNHGNKILERSYPDDYFNCDHLSNHFTEYVRITCQFGTYDTPLDIWNSIKDEDTIKSMTPFEQREYIYSSTRECNTFNVTFCLWIINTLVGPNATILDPSSGWGDRLIAALASKALIYNGFDPNKLLRQGYKSIIKTLNITTKASVKHIPFEEAKLKHCYYDIVITSPPYFDLEKYGNDTSQSIIKYPTYTDWLDQFYKTYITKMLLAVKHDGYIVIYIEDITSNNIRYNLREFTIETIKSSNMAIYHSRFGLKVGRAVRWALVWKKL